MCVLCCSKTEITKTPEMDKQALATVQSYLEKNGMPIEKITAFDSSVKPKPDYSFLYTGGNRCIEFIVICYGEICKELRKYPDDEHSQECP